jgi:hypothetical protein
MAYLTDNSGIELDDGAGNLLLDQSAQVTRTAEGHNAASKSSMHANKRWKPYKAPIAQDAGQEISDEIVIWALRLAKHARTRDLPDAVRSGSGY